MGGNELLDLKSLLFVRVTSSPQNQISPMRRNGAPDLWREEGFQISVCRGDHLVSPLCPFLSPGVTKYRSS